MAKIKNTMTVSLEEFGKKAGEYALDEFEYKGLTIRQWADKITSGEYQPVKHGRWEYDHTIAEMKHYCCTNCKNSGNECIADENEILWWNFCPRCGCKLDLGGNGDD